MPKEHSKCKIENVLKQTGDASLLGHALDALPMTRIQAPFYNGICEKLMLGRPNYPRKLMVKIYK